MDDITIGITSCWRLNLLNKTIKSLEKSINLNDYKKIITEDTIDQKIIKKVKQENKNWFLKWWKIIFTWKKWKSNEEKHYNALIQLYNNIDTKYIFHLEDVWLFKKTEFDFIQLSKKILEKNPNISIIQLRDFNKKWWLNKIWMSKKERFDELFSKNILNIEWKEFLKFRNDKYWDSCKWFSLNPWLRRTEEMKKIMFWNKNNKRVDESIFWEEMKKLWLYSIILKDWIISHLGNSFYSTKVIDTWFLEIIEWFYNYRIKDLFLRQFLWKHLNNLYYFFDKITFTRFLMDKVSFLYRKINTKKINKESLTNIEWIKNMNIPINWFYENKILWISWVARIKNWDDFLEEVIESHIAFLDEIILVDNLSTDKSKKICLDMQKKYPKKIKFFEYNYNVFSQWQNNNNISNSIHSLAYYYNWCFSKTKYKYVMKLDDDNYLIKEKWEKIRNHILNKKQKKYFVYWWVNLLKKDWRVWVASKNKYLGKYWDHWIYSVSDKTYYIQHWEVEKFISNLDYYRFWFSFFHLKFLKKDYWLWNYINTDRWKKQLEDIKNSKILDIKNVTWEKININNFIKNE